MTPTHLTYVFIGVGALVFVLGFFWPANSRRWGTDEVPQSARQQADEWDVGPVRVLPARPEPPAIYRVGEPLILDSETGDVIEPGRLEAA